MKKTTTLQNFCPNCETPFPASFNFCSNCGQKDIVTHPTVKELLQEFIDNVFNLDAKIFQTLKALAKPGQLTIDYFNGKRKCYYSPIRLFLVSLILFFACLNWFELDIIQIETDNDKVYADYKESIIFNKLDTMLSDFQVNAKDTVSLQLLDTIRQKVKSFDNTHQNFNFPPFLNLEEENGKRRKIPREDLYSLTGTEMADKYEIKGFFKRLYFIQFLKFLKDGNRFGRYFSGNLTWTILLMMPFYALISWFIYRKQNRFYIEHLVFSLHLHSAAALTIIPGVFLSIIWKYFIILPLLIAFLYPFFAMKNYYGGTYWEVFKKANWIQLLYIPIILIIFTFSLLLSFLLF